MPSPEQMGGLEARIARLEQAVQQLQRDTAPSAIIMRGLERAEQILRPRKAMSEPVESSETTPLPVVPQPPAEDVARDGERHEIVSEQWLGQRAFLAIGVVAALAALGYFLVLAFDRGWISPATRCGGGAVVGLITAAAGWRLFQRGLHRYGAALIGTGVGMNYLAAWAATKLYGFMPTLGGAASLAGLSVLLTMIALLLDVQALAAAAVIGGLLAPIFLGVGKGAGTLFLVYLGVLILGLGWAAVSRRWRLTARLLAVFSLLLMPMAAEGGASALGLAVYGGVIGLSTMLAGMQADWPGIRMIGFLSGWAALWASAGSGAKAPWATLAAALVLSWPSWRAGLRREVMPGDEVAVEPEILLTSWRQRPVSPEVVYFYVTAIVLSLILSSVLPGTTDALAILPGTTSAVGAALLAVGVGYLAPGLPLRIPAFEWVSTVAFAIATMLLAPSVSWTCWILLLQAVAWAASDHALGRTGGRWLALVPLVGTVYWLMASLMAYPPAGDPAFVGIVSRATWGLVAVAAALAGGLWRRTDGDGSAARSIPRGLWALGGTLVLVGVTREISWYFRNAPLPEHTRLLAGGLLVSAWWTVFAGGLVAVGFRLRTRPIRLAGLMVAGVAAAKVVLVDLKTLEALYRIGSVLILAIVFLGVSYLYNRRARTKLLPES